MLLQLAGFIFDCTCIILPKPIVHIDNYCYLYCSTLFIPCTALYFCSAPQLYPEKGSL